MSKPKKSVMQWLSETFGGSHKAISENLSAEQYKVFVTEAGQAVSSEDDDTDEESDDDQDDDQEEDQDDDQEETGKSTDAKDMDFESRLKALEDGLTVSQSALKAEKKVSKDLSTKVSQLETKLTESETKLRNSETQRQKLRNAVNPLGDEDITNKETDLHLTQADIEARASYKANLPVA